MIKIYETRTGGIFAKSSSSDPLSVMPFKFRPSIESIEDETLIPRLEKIAEKRMAKLTLHPESGWEASCYFPSGWGEPERKLFATIND